MTFHNDSSGNSSTGSSREIDENGQAGDVKVMQVIMIDAPSLEDQFETFIKTMEVMMSSMKE